MALKRVSKDGFGQVELNNVAFQRDGSIEAQCRLSEDFKVVPAENGMILGIDNRTRTVYFPSDQTLMYGLNYSTEHMYDNRKKGLKDFKLNEGDFYPRLGYLVVGDKFTSNTLAYSDEEFETEELLFAAPLLYGGVSELGAILVSATLPTEGPVLKVVSKTTMPDGQRALKFQVIEYLTPIYVEEEEEIPPVVEPVVPDAPEDLVGISPTDSNDADGKITGVDDTMEWQADGGTDWTPVGEAETEIENLASGTYHIRYKEVGETPASEPATVIIEPFNEG